MDRDFTILIMFVVAFLVITVSLSAMFVREVFIQSENFCEDHDMIFVNNPPDEADHCAKILPDDTVKICDIIEIEDKLYLSCEQGNKE